MTTNKQRKTTSVVEIIASFFMFGQVLFNLSYAICHGYQGKLDCPGNEKHADKGKV